MQRFERRLSWPRPGGAPHPLHPVSGPPRIRTENFLVAGQALFQLELAAHGVPSPNEGTRRTTGLVRAHILPSQVACVVHGVPLWSCQCSSTFTRRRCRAGMARVEHAFRRFWRPAPSRWVIPMHTKAARQVSLRAAPGRNWVVPIQKPPASPECPSVARTRVCRHTFRLAGDRLPRVSRAFLPVWPCCLLLRVRVGYGRRNGLFRAQFPQYAPESETSAGYSDPGWELDNAAARTPTRRSVMSRLRDVPTYEPDAGATSE